jgi:hypothetical protein
MRTFSLVLTPVAVVAIIAGALSGCGGDGETTTIPGVEGGASEDVPGNADPEAVEVIRGWVDSLREGDVEKAASYFAIPSVAENGPVLIRITNRARAVTFNRSLPCGARLTRAETQGRFTTATFRLTERPGPGRCGPGTGGEAETSFVIRDGRIVQWRRVGATPEPAPGQAT